MANHYFKVSSRLVEDGHIKGLSHGALKLLLAITQQAKRAKGQYAEASFTHMMNLTGCDKKEVQSAVSELKELKLIRASEGTGGNSAYTVFTPLVIVDPSSVA